MINLKKNTNRYLITLLLLLGSQFAMSCTVPVFQYAMERWTQSYYEGVLLYQHELSEEEKAIFTRFQKMFRENNALLNLRVEKMDVHANSGKYQRLIKDYEPENLPALALWFPRQKGKIEPFWTGKLQIEQLEHIIKSAKRKEITGHLLEGSPLVWMLIAPGDQYPVKDYFRRLKDGISVSVEAMKKQPQYRPLIVKEDEVVTFPVVTVSADNPDESVLVSMVTGIQDGVSLDEPIVVPVFGRGRALTSFPAKEISKEQIYNIMTFLMSPCACQIKMASPGMDMLIKAEWSEAFDEYAQPASTPTLTSVMPDSTKPAAAITAENDSIIDLTTGGNSSFMHSRILNSTLGIIGILVVILGILTVIVLKRK